jgi:hypothetical protein
VKIWLDKGWVIIPSERRGYVISGEKKMRALDKIALVLGPLLIVLSFVVGYKLPAILGVVLILAAWLDYQFNTKPPTQFFPAPGEQSRVMNRE